MKPFTKTVWHLFVNNKRIGGDMNKSRAMQLGFHFHMFDDAVHVRSHTERETQIGTSCMFGEVTIEFLPGSWPCQYGKQGKRTRGRWVEPKYLRGYGKLGKPMRRRHK